MGLQTVLCAALITLACNVAADLSTPFNLYGQFSVANSLYYPRPYPVNVNTTWIVHRLANDVCIYNIEWLAMDVQQSAGCTKDYLDINGRKFCGNQNPGTITVQVQRRHNLVIKFVSDGSISKQGFSIIIEQSRFSCSFVEIKTTSTRHPITTPIPLSSTTDYGTSRSTLFTLEPTSKEGTTPTLQESTSITSNDVRLTPTTMTVPITRHSSTDLPKNGSTTDNTKIPVILNSTTNIPTTGSTTTRPNHCAMSETDKYIEMVTNASTECQWNLRDKLQNVSNKRVEVNALRQRDPNYHNCSSYIIFKDYKKICHNFIRYAYVSNFCDVPIQEIKVHNGHQHDPIIIKILLNSKCKSPNRGHHIHHSPNAKIQI